jgi:hypothetical protein
MTNADGWGGQQGRTFVHLAGLTGEALPVLLDLPRLCHLVEGWPSQREPIASSCLMAIPKQRAPGCGLA